MATRKSQAASEEARRKSRESKLAEVEDAIKSLQTQLSEHKVNKKKKLTQLDSVSEGLYEEVDKLSKKAPAEKVTDLALGQINDVIRETKLLVPEDPYIRKLVEFVPAGDNPEHRDAVMVLRQIRQGLQRFQKDLEAAINSISSRLGIAQGLDIGLQYLIEGQRPTRKDLQNDGVSLNAPWTELDFPHELNSDLIDRTDLKEYLLGPQ